MLVEQSKDLLSVKELRNILLFKLRSHYIAVFLFFYPVYERHEESGFSSLCPVKRDLFLSSFPEYVFRCGPIYLVLDRNLGREVPHFLVEEWHSELY